MLYLPEKPRTMERVCLCCGAAIRGREDKKFCNDECRNAWHNERRRASEKKVRKVNTILSNNWRILDRLYRDGVRTVSADFLSAKGFNFDVYTQMSETFFKRRTYSCFGMSYRRSASGRVHIFPIFTA